MVRLVVKNNTQMICVAIRLDYVHKVISVVHKTNHKIAQPPDHVPLAEQMVLHLFHHCIFSTQIQSKFGSLVSLIQHVYIVPILERE